MSGALTPQEAGALVPVSLSHEVAAAMRAWWVAAKAHTVTDAASAERADTLVTEARALVVDIDLAVKPTKLRLDELKASVVAREKAYKGPITEQATRLKDETLAFMKRRDADARAAAEQARRDREALAVAAVPICTRCHEPVDEQGCFCKDGAPTLLAPPPPARPVLLPTPPPAPVLAGQTVRKTWRFKVTNVSLLPKEFQIVTVSANEAMIAAVVKGMEGKTAIPGVEVWEDEVLVAVARRPNR